MKCLLRYQWVKLPRARLPQGKGLMGFWTRLASRAAFRKGHASYCGYRNDVTPGTWAGGMVGLKSILGVKSRAQALTVMDSLQKLGYIGYTLDPQTKKLTYTICDWVVKCSGAECSDGTVYATDGYGFLCLPRSITQRLADKQYQFEESDAWLDLWCHTVWQDPCNSFSYQAPAVQYGRYGAALTLETLGQRWGWEKTKVWRFFQKHGDVFTLYRLPGSYGCLIFNKLYPSGAEVSDPDPSETERILNKIRILGENTHISGADNVRLGKMIAWFSQKTAENTEAKPDMKESVSRVALPAPIIRAYFSQCWNCKNCVYDCRVKNITYPAAENENHIRGPCMDPELLKFKGDVTYEQSE
ncbi:MAG: hypothetical protein QM689_07405 [Oscillospiraceae bacterium]